MKYPELTATAFVTLTTLAIALVLGRPQTQTTSSPAPAAAPATTTSATPASTPATSTATTSSTEASTGASTGGGGGGYAAGTGVPTALPDGEMGKLVKLGQELVHDTAKNPITAKYVGNKLNCTSCHLNDGQTPQSGSFVGLAAAYPAYSAREGGVINLDDRIANCYMRSMNGKRPPLNDLSVRAIATYITWLSQGAHTHMNAKQPLGPNGIPKLPYTEEEAAAKAHKDAGKTVFAAKCAACHGAQGQGQANFPPVWGDGSYNDGAGMHSIQKSASWIKVSMPLGNPNLSEQEALDVAAFINAQPRPKFVMAQHLLPGESPPQGSLAQPQANTP